MTEPNDQYEYAGYEDVISLIEGLAIQPTASVQAAHVASAAGAVSKPGVRSFRSQSRPTRGATVTVFRRGTAALVAAIVSVSGLAAAGVLPEDVQNAVSGTARLLGVNLPTPQSSSISTPSSTEPETGAGIDEEQPTRPAGLVSPPSPPASSDDECAVVAAETEESTWSDSEEDADESQAPCSEASEEDNEGDESDETPDSDDEEDVEHDERDDDDVGDSTDADDDDDEEEADSDD